MLLKEDQFLSRLTLMFDQTRGKGHVQLTMKRYDGKTKPAPRPEKIVVPEKGKKGAKGLKQAQQEHRTNARLGMLSYRERKTSPSPCSNNGLWCSSVFSLVSLSVRLLVCACVWLFACSFACLSACLSVCPSACLSVSLSVCMSA